jgi:hypothetical protein
MSIGVADDESEPWLQKPPILLKNTLEVPSFAL